MLPLAKITDIIYNIFIYNILYITIITNNYYIITGHPGTAGHS